MSEQENCCLVRIIDDVELGGIRDVIHGDIGEPDDGQLPGARDAAGETEHRE